MGRLAASIKAKKRLVMEHTFSIRKYVKGDEEKILELWQAVYPDRHLEIERWLTWWKWMYTKNPAGKGWIWLAEDNGKIIGQYSLFLMKLKVKDKVFNIVQNIDLMVHPEYRHRGIFFELEKQALLEAEKEKVYITIGFPNKQAYPGHTKSGWFHVEFLRRWIIPLNWKKVIKLKVRNKLYQVILATGIVAILYKIFFRAQKTTFIEGLTIKKVAAFNKGFNKLWDKVSNQSPIMVERKQEYLNWRYSIPDKHYYKFIAEKDQEIVGYTILHHELYHGVKVANIVDLMAISKDILNCIVSRVIEECRREQIDLVSYSLLAGTTYYEALEKNGFMSFSFIKGENLCIYSNTPSIPVDFLKNPQNWLVQHGDSDHI